MGSANGTLLGNRPVGDYSVGMKETNAPPERTVWFTVRVQPPVPVFITPPGEPANLPIEAGTDPNNIPDGANDFTYSAASPGVLTVKLKARVPGLQSLSAADQARYKFVVWGVGDSDMA